MKEFKKYILKMLKNEYWYGPLVNDRIVYPLNNESNYEVDLDPNRTPNQANTILLSNKGRYIWCNSGFKLKIYKRRERKSPNK